MKSWSQVCKKLLLCISTFYIYAVLPQRQRFHEELMRCLAVSVAQWEKEGKGDKKQMRERFSAKWSAVGLPSTTVFLMVWRNALILSLSSTATLRSPHVLPFLHPFYPFLIQLIIFTRPACLFCWKVQFVLGSYKFLSYLPVTDTPGASLFKVTITIFCSLVPGFNLYRLLEPNEKRIFILFYLIRFHLVYYLFCYVLCILLLYNNTKLNNKISNCVFLKNDSTHFFFFRFLGPLCVLIIHNLLQNELKMNKKTKENNLK